MGALNLIEFIFLKGKYKKLSACIGYLNRFSQGDLKAINQ